MIRKLAILAVLMGTCVLCPAGRPSAARSFPLCNSGYCANNPNKVCTCPSGTVRAGLPAPCGTWTADCNDL
jgi:hypothetical protein